MTTEKELAARWVQHFKEMLNQPELNKPANPDPSDDLNIYNMQPTSQADVETAIKAMKNGKSPGIDSRPVELLKADATTSSLVLADLFAKIWNLLGIPIDWSIRLIHTIPNKGASTIVTTVARHNTSPHFSSFPARYSAENSSKSLIVP